MPQKNTQEKSLNELRKRAEAKVRDKEEKLPHLSPDEVQKLIHELNVHQIELEMQNEGLRRAQQEIEEQRDRFSNLYDFAPVGYFTLSDKNIILEVNLRACEILVTTRNSIIKKPFSNYITDRDQDVFYRHRKLLLETGKRQTCELRMKKNDHEEFWASLESILIHDKESGKQLIRISFTDITEQKHLEDELQKAQKLESIGTLAGGIAHDFNNLLTGIFGYTELARLNSKPGSQVHNFLNDAMSSFSRAKDLAKQLLTFAKGEAPEKKIISIPKILRQSTQLALSGSNIESEISLSKDISAVNADESQLGQVFNNIIINSRQAMPDGGKVEIKVLNLSVKQDQIPILPEGSYVYITIKDNGTGIPETALPKIFDPFFSTKKTGSGLGLAISYSIIIKHDGFIKVDSTIGKGAIVAIWLPAVNKGQATINDEAPSNVVSKDTGRILVMDDEFTILDLAEKILVKSGYKVEFAKNGEEALELYKTALTSKKPFDLVILDLTVPGAMGGEHTIRELLKLDPKVKGIVSSGYSEDPILTNPPKYGFIDKLSKPYLNEELLQKVQDVLMNYEVSS